MTYFADLTPYGYWNPEPGTLNVGWLSVGHHFETAVPNEADLELLWQFCKVEVTATRGLHGCEFCEAWRIEHCDQIRNGETLRLGYSEIRVFSPDGRAYAAPSLIYHYVAAHSYAPPSEFLTALRTGPRPTSDEYRAQLAKRQLEWDSTIRD